MPILEGAHHTSFTRYISMCSHSYLLGLSPAPAPTYAQRGTNILQIIFKEHFQDFANGYEEKYASTYPTLRAVLLPKA